MPTLDPVPPTTTAEQDRHSEGQRAINRVWEYTQALVTIMITGAAIYCAVVKIDSDILNFAFVAIVSTYYARTNHTNVGGVRLGQLGR